MVWDTARWRSATPLPSIDDAETHLKAPASEAAPEATYALINGLMPLTLPARLSLSYDSVMSINPALMTQPLLQATLEWHSHQRGELRQYRDRTGFPDGIVQARGAAKRFRVSA